MIKTILEDIFLSFLFGQIFALSAEPLLKKEESLINTYFIRALLFQLLVFFPFGLFLAKMWTAWSWMYFINPHHHSKWWTFLAVCAYVPAMIAGFHIAYTFIRAGKTGQTYWYLAGSALSFCLLFFPLMGRVNHISDEWLPPAMIHTAPMWYKNFGFMLSMAVGGAYFFGALSYVLRLNRADRRRLAREAFSKPASPTP